MAQKNNNAFLKHLTAIRKEMNYSGIINSKDIQKIHEMYMTSTIAEFKNNAKIYLKHKKEDD